MGADWKIHQLVMYCGFGVAAGMVGGLLGLGGGFILGPLFLELGIPPQVTSSFLIIKHVQDVVFWCHRELFDLIKILLIFMKDE